MTEIINQIEEPKKKVGRPRMYDIPDCENKTRKSLREVNRYKTDEEYRNKIKEKNKLKAREKYDLVKAAKYKLFLDQNPHLIN